ncbi:transcription initiation factor IIF subunit alpha-like isoform X2 [Hevea brasiliensis]|uniref:transcription initiation factor IIF subunit alpha-like isoform X2 n=1 Tax=Hevea brasiliensis TaxID=3981 RepID=UPI0025FA70C8|nr:transcription initiation factor IIF subunit alpha-like isoform X2 [Hevea brasiliensis]
MSLNLLLNRSCSECGTFTKLYETNCMHLTLCVTCGENMAKNLAKCDGCGASITHLIRECNIRSSPVSDKNYFIGRFQTGLPNFPKGKDSKNKWFLHKGLRGQQLKDALLEQYKNRPWLLEDEAGQSHYQGHLKLEGSQSATYYLLILKGKEIVAVPTGSWYNFNMVAQYRQLTLEEAEEKMMKKRKNAAGYERWMMKAAKSGSAAFGEVVKGDREKIGDDEGSNGSDKGEEDEKAETEKNDDVEKGDEWEHEEIFTDDDEAVGNDPEEQGDLALEVSTPPEIKQVFICSMYRLQSRRMHLGRESDDNSAAKPMPSGSSAPSASKSAKGKRKSSGDDAKPSNGMPQKKELK